MPEHHHTTSTITVPSIIPATTTGMDRTYARSTSKARMFDVGDCEHPATRKAAAEGSTGNLKSEVSHYRTNPRWGIERAFDPRCRVRRIWRQCLLAFLPSAPGSSAPEHPEISRSEVEKEVSADSVEPVTTPSVSREIRGLAMMAVSRSQPKGAGANPAPHP